MKEFDTAQVEQLKTIGDYLYRERQEQAISLDEIAVKTYIPLRLLQALELGNVERLPEPVFVQGFIRRYADAIGLDGAALAKSFTPQPSFVVERKAPEPERLDRTEKPRVESTPALDAVHDHAERSNSKLPFLLLGTAAALLMGVGLAAMFNRPQAETSNQDSQPVAAESNAANPGTQSSVAVAPSPSLSSQVAASPSPRTTAQASETSVPTTVATDATTGPVQVAVKLTGESWLQVIADDKVEFEGTLQKGEQKNWQAQKTLVLQAGNAGAVSVSYNQGEPKVLGAAGEVKDVTFPPDVKPKPASTN